MIWFLYIVVCADGSLYTGITKNITSRILKHNSGKGAKSLKGKLPVKIVHIEEFGNHSSALKREFAIKKLTRLEKLKLVEN